MFGTFYFLICQIFFFLPLTHKAFFFQPCVSARCDQFREMKPLALVLELLQIWGKILFPHDLKGPSEAPSPPCWETSHADTALVFSVCFVLFYFYVESELGSFLYQKLTVHILVVSSVLNVSIMYKRENKSLMCFENSTFMKRFSWNHSLTCVIIKKQHVYTHITIWQSDNDYAFNHYVIQLLGNVYMLSCWSF